MRGIVFDLDDTLYPLEHYRISGFAAVSEYLEVRDGIPALRSFGTLWRAHLDAPGRELQVLARTTGLPIGRVGEWLAAYRGHTPDISLAPAAAGVLARLRRGGWRLGILTNGAPPVQRRKLAALGVLPLVDAHLCADDITLGGKPAQRCFEAMLAELGTDPRQTIHVGDDPVADVGGGRRAGLWTVRMRTARHAGPLAADADLVVARLDDLVDAAARLIPEELAHVA